MFDYLTLKLIWWLLVGVLLIGFAIMDGHDMGVGTLLPFLGKDDTDRRVMINTVAPHWDGNQVWFITAGGAIFAAWPVVYATAFSGLYWALLLVLFALFFRPVGFDYRSKLQDVRWRSAWDYGLFAGSAVPALVFGVAFGNLFQGVPFYFDDSMRSFYTGSFWALLNPMALLFGVVSLSLLTLQGATFLAHRTEGPLQERALERGAAVRAGAAGRFLRGRLLGVAHRRLRDQVHRRRRLGAKPDGESSRAATGCMVCQLRQAAAAVADSGAGVRGGDRCARVRAPDAARIRRILGFLS